MSGLRETQKAGRRKSIVAAARRYFLERGYEATTIEAIAEAAGVSSVTIYNHYGTKGGVLLAVVRESDVILIEKIGALSGDPPKELVAAVLAFSQTIFEHAFSYLNKAIWRHVIATSVIEGGSDFGQGFAELERDLARLLAELLDIVKAQSPPHVDFDSRTAADALYNLHNARFIQFMSNDSAEISDLYAAVRADVVFTLEPWVAVPAPQSLLQRKIS